MGEPTELYRIGEAAELSGLSVRTLRHWDQAGLVVPHGRSDGGYRLYTRADVDLLVIVRYMKPLDITVEEMRTLLADRSALLESSGATSEVDPAAAERFQLLLARADHRVRRLTEQLEEVIAFSVRLSLELETRSPALVRPIRARPES